jgi:hypothetical protein
MVNMKEQEIHLAEKTHSIQRWEVWFMTPFGLLQTYEEAEKRLQGLDLDPDTCVLPVPVAISGDVYEVVCRS